MSTRLALVDEFLLCIVPSQLITLRCIFCAAFLHVSSGPQLPGTMTITLSTQLPSLSRALLTSVGIIPQKLFSLLSSSRPEFS